VMRVMPRLRNLFHQCAADVTIVGEWSAILTLPDCVRVARHVTRIRPRPGCRGHMRSRLFSSWGRNTLTAFESQKELLFLIDSRVAGAVQLTTSDNNLVPPCYPPSTLDVDRIFTNCCRPAPECGYTLPATGLEGSHVWVMTGHIVVSRQGCSDAPGCEGLIGGQLFV
jgi:hypothetical protein